MRHLKKPWALAETPAQGSAKGASHQRPALTLLDQLMKSRNRERDI